jgi:hypothetical protein
MHFIVLGADMQNKCRFSTELCSRPIARPGAAKPSRPQPWSPAGLQTHQIMLLMQLDEKRALLPHRAAG